LLGKKLKHIHIGKTRWAFSIVTNEFALHNIHCFVQQEHTTDAEIDLIELLNESPPFITKTFFLQVDRSFAPREGGFQEIVIHCGN